MWQTHFQAFVVSDKTVKNKNRRISFPQPNVFFPPVFLLEMALPCFVSGVYPQAKSDSVDRHQAKNAVGFLRCVDLGQPQKMGN